MAAAPPSDQVLAAAEAVPAPLPEPAAQTTDKRRRRIRELDFTRPTKFSQDQQRRIGRGHDGFCRTAQSQLSAELRTTVELEVTNIDQQTWAVAVNELPGQPLYAVISTSTGLPLLLCIDQSGATMMIERLLGGNGRGVTEERDLTEIEVALATKLFQTMVVQLSRAWHELMSTELMLTAVETQQNRIQLAPQSEPTLSVRMELKLSETATSSITLLIPHRSVEVMLTQLPAGHYGDGHSLEPDAEVEQMLKTALRGVTVEVRAEVGSRQMTVDEVVALKRGDVVQLGPAASGATVYAGAVPIYRARPGRSANRRAVEVLERMEEL